MRKIDMNGHIVFTETLGKGNEYGPEYLQMDGQWKFRVGPYTAEVPRNEDPRETMYLLNDPDWFRARLDEAGIDMLGISGPPMLYLDWAPLEITVPFHRLQNDCMAKFCSVHPDRFFWCASVPLQHIGETIAELKRCAALGGRGVNICSGASVYGLDDPAMWPFYSTLVELDLALFIHPYPEPMAVTQENKDHLSLATGFSTQETDPFATMVLGGVFDEFPGLRVTLTHGGGFTPCEIGRIDGAWRMQRPGVKCRQSPYEYRKNFWIDILAHDDTARRFLVESWGVDNLVIGSDYFGLSWSDGFLHLEALGLSEEDQAKLSFGNAAKLFKLPQQRLSRGTFA